MSIQDSGQHGSSLNEIDAVRTVVRDLLVRASG
jgi:hypothetical protein